MFHDLEAILIKHRQGQTILRRMGRRTEPACFAVGSPASVSQMSSAEQSLGHRLPDDFKAFLTLWNGAELYISKEYGGGILIHSIEALLEENSASDRFESEPRYVLIIGNIENNAELFLDFRQPDKSDWPVYWADPYETIEEALSREPIAQSFHDFINRLISVQGDYYWEEPDFTPIWRVELPDLWRHGFGWYVAKSRRPQPMIGIGGYDRAPSTSPLAIRILVGIIQFLKKHGATPVLFREGHLFSVSEELFSEFDPEVIPPVEMPRAGWVEIEGGIWLHGPEEAACYVHHGYGFDEKPSHTKVTLSWAESEAGDTANAVRKHLEALGAHLSWPAHVPDGYESAEAYLPPLTRFEP